MNSSVLFWGNLNVQHFLRDPVNFFRNGFQNGLYNGFLRKPIKWLSLISNPKSNVVQVLQDRFQSKLDDCFSEEEIEIDDQRILYPSKNFIKQNSVCIKEQNNNDSDYTYQDDDGNVFNGKIINGERNGRGIHSRKRHENNEEICVEGFYHHDVLVGNVLRITRGIIQLKSEIEMYFSFNSKHL